MATSRRSFLEGLTAAGGVAAAGGVFVGCEVIDEIPAPGEVVDDLQDLIDELTTLTVGDQHLVWHPGNGAIYQVLPDEHAVARIDAQGNEIWRREAEGGQPGEETELNRPTHLVTAPDGSFYLVDRGNHRVLHVDENGDLLNVLGGPGDPENPEADEGELHAPRDVALDSDGNVYVTDQGNHRVHVFDPDGTPAGTIGGHGDSGAEDHELNTPRGITIDSDDRIHVVDSGNGRVQVYERSGEWVRNYGEFDEEGEAGHHFLPHSITTDPIGNSWVSDPLHEVMQIYRPNGDPLLRINQLSLDDGRRAAPLEVGFTPDGAVYARVHAWTEQEPPEPPEEEEGEQ